MSDYTIMEEALVVAVPRFFLENPLGNWAGPFVNVQLLSSGEVLSTVPILLGFGHYDDTGLPQEGDHVLVGYIEGSFGKKPIVVGRKPTAWVDQMEAGSIEPLSPGEKRISSALGARITLGQKIQIDTTPREGGDPALIEVDPAGGISLIYGDTTLTLDVDGAITINGQNVSLDATGLSLVASAGLLLSTLGRLHINSYDMKAQVETVCREEVSEKKEIRTPLLTIASSDDASREAVALAETLKKELDQFLQWAKVHTHPTSGVPPATPPQDFTTDWFSKISETE